MIACTCMVTPAFSRYRNAASMPLSRRTGSPLASPTDSRPPGRRAQALRGKGSEAVARPEHHLGAGCEREEPALVVRAGAGEHVLIALRHLHRRPADPDRPPQREPLAVRFDAVCPDEAVRRPHDVA